MNLSKKYKSKSSILLPARDFGVNEECGIIGISAQNKSELHRDIYYGLFSLQHRGQESAGIAVSYEAKKIHYYKKMGLVNDIFSNEIMDRYPQSKCACGHVRYSSSGSNNVVNAQPVVFYGRYGRMAIVHNGNIINCDQLKSKLMKRGHIFQSSIDAEVIGTLVNDYASDNLFDGVTKACNEIEGAFTFMIMSDNKIIAVRDRYGLKPLVMGSRNGEIIIASESCALDSLEATLVRDIDPGEIIMIEDGKIVNSIHMPNPVHRKPCIFEYVYLARSDSAIDGVEVYDARYKCGQMLAKLFKIDADVVAGVPDSAIVAARGYSDVSGIPYIDALSKNRYIGRTFIQPSQSMRENSVKIKLNAIRANIKGKRLILVDDSIVRGTTSLKIIQLLRQNGVKEVHMIIASPIVANPCFFGVDMETKDQLVGAYRNEEEICKLIGADSLHYLPIDCLVNACGGKREDFCSACFDGNYPMDLSKYNTNEFVLDIK